jgi:hypothetical protein
MWLFICVSSDDSFEVLVVQEWVLVVQEWRSSWTYFIERFAVNLASRVGIGQEVKKFFTSPLSSTLKEFRVQPGAILTLITSAFQAIDSIGFNTVGNGIHDNTLPVANPPTQFTNLANVFLKGVFNGFWTTGAYKKEQSHPEMSKKNSFRKSHFKTPQIWSKCADSSAHALAGERRAQLYQSSQASTLSPRQLIISS